ncbi:hypothetical protein BD626DRAFT_508058 [Schizophyllum amplum]|uniref:Uncharacterized protein n=1 Tax=Schizophyllum amplum TaxID=97359 RepID=A0A550C3K3_9AGAR|nr:hypothetical protein BD626DRAFT_508058 [Auriculariopsis ampla]
MRTSYRRLSSALSSDPKGFWAPRSRVDVAWLPIFVFVNLGSRRMRVLWYFMIDAAVSSVSFAGPPPLGIATSASIPSAVKVRRSGDCARDNSHSLELSVSPADGRSHGNNSNLGPPSATYTSPPLDFAALSDRPSALDSSPAWFHPERHSEPMMHEPTTNHGDLSDLFLPCL